VGLVVRGNDQVEVVGVDKESRRRRVPLIPDFLPGCDDVGLTMDCVQFAKSPILIGCQDKENSIPFVGLDRQCK